MRILSYRAVWLMAVIGSLAGFSEGQTLSWNNPGSGTFGVSSNWTPAVVPALSGHTALFGLTGSYTVNFSASHSFGTLLTANQNTLRFNAAPGVVVNPGTFVRFGGTSSTPAVIWSGGTLRTNPFNIMEIRTSVNAISGAFFDTGSLLCGTGGSQGFLSVSSGTLQAFRTTSVGGDNSNGELTLNASVGTLTGITLGVPGGNGTGVMNVRDGSNVSVVGSVNIGVQGAVMSNSFMEINGASRVTMSGAVPLNIGGSTVETVGASVSRGGTLFMDRDFSNQRGTFTTGTGPIQINVGGSLHILHGTFEANGDLTNQGRIYSAGTFTTPSTQTTIVNSRSVGLVNGFPQQVPGLESLGSFRCGTLLVGSAVGSDAWVRMTGVSTISSMVSVGDAATGLMTLASLQTPSMVVGRQGAGRGTVLPVGNSTFGAVTIGALGHGTVDLGSGVNSFNGMYVSGPTILGQSAGSSGTLIVAGSAGTLGTATFHAPGQGVFVGVNGAGTLILGQRGIMDVATLTIGSTGGTGTGTVVQSGGTMNVSAVHVNQRGAYIYNGGSVAAPIDNAGTLQLNTTLPQGFGTINNLSTGRIFATGGLFAGDAVINNAGSFGGAGTLAAGMTLNNTGTFSAANGEFVVEPGAILTNASGSLLRNAPASTLRIRAPLNNLGNVEVNAGGVVQIASGSLNIPPGQTLTLKGGLLVAGDGDELSIASGAGAVGFGQIDAAFVNDGSVQFNGPTQLIGSFENTAFIEIRNATTIVYGPAFNAGSILVQSGTVVFEQAFARGGEGFGGGVSGNGALRVEPSGRVVADAVRQTTLSLTGASGASSAVVMRPAAAGGQTSVVQSLSIAGTPGSYIGQVDLADNALVIDYGGASPLGSVVAYLTTGRAGGAWNGRGVASSEAAATANRAIGVAEASDIGSPAVFAGEPVDSTSILLRFTLPGDANLDRVVNIGDFALLAANFNQPSYWARGDFTYDGTTGIGDFALLAANFNQSLPATGARPVAVPEAAAGGAVAGLVACLRRRRD